MELSIQSESDSEKNQTTSIRNLAELEQIVERGKASFLEVAEALMEIRDRELYLPKTWGEYVKEKFGFSRQYAHRLIQAKLITDASTVVDRTANVHQALVKRISRAEREARASRSLKRAKPLTKVESESQSLPVTNGANGSFVRIPAMPAVEDLDLETEFTAITKRCDLWISKFDQDDYLDLFNRLIEHLNDLIAEARPETVSDDDDDDGDQSEDSETEEPELAGVVE